LRWTTPNPLADSLDCAHWPGQDRFAILKSAKVVGQISGAGIPLAGLFP
jgi:hypothetical protein